jgi:glycerol-3-phosphate dehydrogenase (NAD(P)+)
LKGVSLHPGLRATAVLNDVVASSEMIFIALPSVFIRGTLTPFGAATAGEAVIVNLAKGIEEASGLTSFQVLGEIFPRHRRVMLSGPCIANEIAQGMPTAVVLAGKDIAALGAVSAVIEREYLQTSLSGDELGVELGGILKNIYAIGLGIFDGKEIKSINFRSVYLTLALEEMMKTGEKLGAKKETFFYLAGLGDLFATSMSEHSHNRRLGELLARGMSLEEIRAAMGVLPEGYTALKTVLRISRERGFSMPVAQDLMNVIQGEISTQDFILSVIREERMYYESRLGGD